MFGQRALLNVGANYHDNQINVGLFPALLPHRNDVLRNLAGLYRLPLDVEAPVAFECEKMMLLDISPTATMYGGTDQAFATAYFHWFMLIQPKPVAETLVGNSAPFLLKTFLGGWGAASHDFIDPAAMAEAESV